MKKALRASLTLLIVCAVGGAAANAPVALGNGGALGTVTGSVRDNRGNPLAGAVIALLRDGANEVIKETRSADDGTFSARIAPGRYSVRATANGFNEALFSSVQIRPSDELIYRFNLEPADSGRTTAGRRNDRDSAKWRLRSAQSRRSIFQIDEGDDQTINAVLEASEEVASAEDDDATAGMESASPRREIKNAVRTQGVVETFVAASANPLAPRYAGMNFAVARPVGGRVNLVFAGQLGAGAGAPQRFETTARVRANDRHRISFSAGAGQAGAFVPNKETSGNTIGQLSVRAVDEWIVRDGVVIVLGIDYSRLIGLGGAHSISPRLGLQFDATARTRLKAAYAPGSSDSSAQSVAQFESDRIVFKQPVSAPIALVDGRAVLERSRRFEFGVERVLDNASSIETTAFFDTTSNRGVGLLSAPLSAFSGESSAALINVANQQGAARGMRVVYSRRINQFFTTSTGYAFGRGQRLSQSGARNPSGIFSDGFFQTAALQMNAELPTGTHVQTVFRFSPRATVFAIDPFAGRLAVYDPSLSIVVTQDLPTFGLPVRAEAIIDARNLLDTQASTDDGETLMLVTTTSRRSVRGGISVRF